MSKRRRVNDDVEASPASALHELDVNTAQECALAFQDQLRGFVSLVTSWDHSLESIVGSYQWVQFRFGGRKSTLVELKARAKAARAASVLWKVVACCEGFSGSENPVFWKTVFNDHRRGEFDRVTVITDAVRFFQHEPFPRFQISFDHYVSIEDVQTICKVFLDDQDNQDMVELHRLAPYVLVDRMHQAVDVSITVGYRGTAVYLPSLAGLVSTIQDKALNQGPDIDRNGILPRFLLLEVSPGSFKIEHEGDASLIERFLRSVLIKIPLLSFTVDPGVPLPAIAHLLEALCDPAAQCCVKTFSWTCETKTNRAIGALCSILPHARSLERVWLTLDQPSEEEEQDEDGFGSGFPPYVDDDATSPDHLWYWLDYALLHPDSVQSPCQKLDLVIRAVSSKEKELFRSLGTHRSHRKLQLREGSILRADPRMDGRVWKCLDVSTTLSVCEWRKPSLEETQWVCVVAPGFGYGWTERASIVKELNEPVALPQLVALRWTGSWREHLVITAFLEFLRRYGLQLKYVEHDLALEIDDVLAMFSSTPSLLVLALRSLVGCSPWGESNLPRFQGRPSLRLRELDIAMGSVHLESLAGPLKNVTTLRVMSQSLDDLNTLLKYHRPLQYLHGFDVGSYRLTNYPNLRTRSRAVLGVDERPTAIGPLAVQNRLAFCSVLKIGVQRGIMADNWDREMLNLIFEFASIYLPREVWADTVAENVDPLYFGCRPMEDY